MRDTPKHFNLPILCTSILILFLMLLGPIQNLFMYMMQFFLLFPMTDDAHVRFVLIHHNHHPRCCLQCYNIIPFIVLAFLMIFVMSVGYYYLLFYHIFFFLVEFILFIFLNVIKIINHKMRVFCINVNYKVRFTWRHSTEYFVDEYLMYFYD